MTEISRHMLIVGGGPAGMMASSSSDTIQFSGLQLGLPVDLTQLAKQQSE